MLLALKRRRGLSACTTLALMGAMALAVLGPLHFAASDDVCDVVAVIHDANAHRFSAAQTSSHSDSRHCVVCHWLRSLGSPLLHIGGVDRGAVIVGRPIEACDVRPEDACRRQAASRAPPA